MRSADQPDVRNEPSDLFVNLRWVLILATVAFVVFQDQDASRPPLITPFIAVYVGSNLVLAALVRRSGMNRTLEAGVVLFDSVAIALAIWMSDTATADFFFLYFFVVFLSALSERIELIVTAAVLVAILHLGIVAGDSNFREVLATEALSRVPLLFVVGLFFGYMTQRTRSAERQTDQLREERRLRGEAMAGISHDIRNPLSVIEGMAEALLDDDEPLSDRHRRLVHRIHANARQIVSLSANLVDLGQLEADRLEPSRTSVSLQEIIEDTLSLARSAAELKSIRLEWTSRPSAAVEADPRQMRRVIWNLLDNAIKYTPASGCVRIELNELPDRVEIIVSDTGRGLPEEVKRALETRSEVRLSRSRDGTGLGLSLARAMAEANGAQFGISSSSGGTSVALGFPKLPAGALAQPA